MKSYYNLRFGDICHCTCWTFINLTLCPSVEVKLSLAYKFMRIIIYCVSTLSHIESTDSTIHTYVHNYICSKGEVVILKQITP